MVIIGELINTSRKKIGEAVEAGDVAYLQQVAKDQVEAGAHYLDVNCGTMIGKEPETLEWLVKLVQEVVDVPLCLDSPDPAALERALGAHKGTAMINSISLEKERYDAILPLLKETDCSVVALCMDDKGMPETVEQGLEYASRLVDSLGAEGIDPDRIYLDPLVRSVGTGSHYGRMFIDTVSAIKEKYPTVHITCGLSNISFGLPNRRLLNRTFLAMAMAAGMDSAIMDPLDKVIMAHLYAARAVLGQDDFCAEYITAQREGKLEV